MTTVTNPNQALWEKGDFTHIAATMRESADAVVASLGITPGIDVLDLACGDGDTAIPLARLGAFNYGTLGEIFAIARPE